MKSSFYYGKAFKILLKILKSVVFVLKYPQSMEKNPSDKMQRVFKVILNVASSECKTTLQCGLISLSSSLPFFPPFPLSHPFSTMSWKWTLILVKSSTGMGAQCWAFFSF